MTESSGEVTRAPKTFLPLTAPVFHVLASLADGDKHGYAIMKEVKGRTDGEVRLGAGTLYGIVRRLLVAGLISETEDRPGVELDDSRRRYYRLEPLGRAVAKAEVARLERMLMIARSKKLLTGPG